MATLERRAGFNRAVLACGRAIGGVICATCGWARAKADAELGEVRLEDAAGAVLSFESRLMSNREIAAATMDSALIPWPNVGVAHHALEQVATALMS